MTTRIIVAGSRNFTDKEFLYEKCDLVCQKIKTSKIEIVSGCAEGADNLGEKYAISHGYTLWRFPANWKEHGKKAGPIRNKRMAEFAVKADATILLAFPLGESRGTANMIETAKEFDIRTFVFEKGKRNEANDV